MIPDTARSSLQEIQVIGNCRVWMKRDDLIHPFISGNKWRKLRLYLSMAGEQGIRHIITAGGPFSNHILATAAACAKAGICCTALIRGRQQADNHYRLIGQKLGLQAVYLNHEEFEQRAEWVAAHFPGKDVLYIDVGGAGEPGIEGCADIWDEFDAVPDVLLLATATGTTMQGILKGRDARNLHTEIIGVPVLMNAAEQDQTLRDRGFDNWRLARGFERGGFARADAELMQFIAEEIVKTNVLFDPVYTGKAWLALHTLLEQGCFQKGSRIVFLHTGGTLGLFSDRYLDFFR